MRENGQTIGGEQRIGDSAELQRSLNEIARCLNELTNQLHGVAPGAAVDNSAEETRPLMKALNAQFGDEGAEAWARALAETASDEYADQSAQGSAVAQNPQLLQNFDASQNSDTSLNSEPGPELQTATVTHSSVVADEVGAAPNGFSAAPNGFSAPPNCGSAQNCGPTQDFAERLRAHTEERSANVAEFKRVMHRAIAAAQAGWQSRLDADLETATEVWTERVKSSIETSAQRASELVAQSSQQVAQRQEQAIAERIAAMSKSFTDAGIEAENQLAAVRASFEQEIKRAQDVLAQVNSTAGAVDDQAARLASISEIAQQELKRRGTSMLEWHSEQLVQHARQSISEWNERLQGALETAGQRIVGKLGVEFEQQLNSRLDRTRGILDRLETEGRAVENLLRTHQIRMERFSEQAVEHVLGRLEKVGTDWESKIEEKGRAATNKLIADMSYSTTCSASSSTSEPVGARNGYQPTLVNGQVANIQPKEREIATKAEATETVPVSGKERRTIRRLKIARPLLVHPEDPACKEAVETTRNASRFGVYFATAAKHYYPGMQLRVTLGYSPNDPCNAASFGKVLRLDPLENGDWGIAVRILLR